MSFYFAKTWLLLKGQQTLPGSGLNITSIELGPTVIITQKENVISINDSES